MEKEKFVGKKPLLYLIILKNILFELPEKTLNFIKNHKYSTRTKLVINPINNITVLSFLPFILGFYGFLNQKYFKDTKILFFEKNLPKLSIPTEKIEWDTFQYLLKQQTLFNIVVEDVYWSDKNLVFEVPNTTSFFLTTEKNLISSLKIEPSGNYLRKHYLFELTGSNSQLYSNIDEIPVKLQAIYYTNPSNIFLNISTILIEDFNKSNKQLYFIPENLSNQSFLLAVKSNKQKLLPIPKIEQKKIFIKQKNFFNFEKIFESELRKIFINTGLIPNIYYSQTSEIPKLEKNLYGKISKTNEIQNLQNLIREIDNKNVSKVLNLPRLMSGYKYPDMTSKQILGFSSQRKNSRNKNIRISLPSSFLVPQYSKIKILEAPPFLINSKKLVLTNQLDQTTQLYEGPSILIDKQSGLDWKIVIKNSSTNENLQNWLKNYLGIINPLSDSFKNFFGLFESPEINIRNKPNSNDKNQAHYWLTNLSVFENGIITNITPSYFKFERSFYLPFISNTDWRNQLGKSTELNLLPLPILEARIPQKNQPELVFGYKTSVDFIFENPLNFYDQKRNSVSKNLIDSGTVNFIPPTYTYLDQESSQTILSSGIYKKIPSIFSKTSSPIFQDLWEPLTFQSWLVTSQIGFAFLVFNVLKALADNYGRELLVYLLDLVALLGFLDDDLKQEIEILMGQREKGFRIISKTPKNFSNVGGIQNLLPEIVEIVWFLRNAGREFSISKTLPRGVLLSGPPGTGKTLLVQAIAGEAEVPVLALSGSSLLEPGESGALKLEILFQEARRLAPCIVFIDEMDTLAEKRQQVLQNPMGADEILESLSTNSQLKPNQVFSQSNLRNELEDKISIQQDNNKEKLRILMQFLVELDGIQGRDGVVVIGATNRPEMLDPAILRPGRFDRVLELGLPGPEKRKEILKLYSNNLGIDDKISWNYLINRTVGYSAADLASIMNQSSLNAILQHTHHTVETIEYGIDRITTIGFEKPFNSNSNKLSLSTIQLAYYQAGKILLSSLLEHHPPTVVTHLWPRRLNIRALQINQNLQKYFFRLARRIELEHRVIGSYAGKAAEILFLQNTSSLTNISDLGLEDIQFGQNLIKSMIEYWYFYGKTIPIEKNSIILNPYNSKEYRDTTDRIPFFNDIGDNLEFSKVEQFNGDNKNIANSIEQQPQKYFAGANWQYQVSDEFEIATRTFSDWYRLYLPDPQQTERNLEWTPPDEFYHTNSLLEQLTDSINWNELEHIHVDYQIHSLILQSFNKALRLVDQHREVLDKLVYELIYQEILREPEINSILTNFNISYEISDLEIKKMATKEIINSTWGTNSRRNNNKWINIY